MTLRYLNIAFVNFFRGNAELPCFKSRRKKNRFTVPQFVTIENDRLVFPKFKEGIKVNLHRPAKGEVRHCTVSKTPTGKYFVSILCKQEYSPKTATGKSCGIDLGIKDFAVNSDGGRYENHQYLKKYERQLATAQRHLSRKVKGSNRQNRQRLKVAAIHEKIANTRRDRLHKISTQITNAFDVICIEDLNIKGMMANRKLAKHIADASWGTFIKMLEYKAEWNNKKVVKISRWYPSSKTCHECVWKHQDLKLSERQWTCPNGHTLDRDINAAKNILREGLRIIGAVLSDNTLRGINQTSRKHRPMKNEAHLSAVAVDV